MDTINIDNIDNININELILLKAQSLAKTIIREKNSAFLKKYYKNHKDKINNDAKTYYKNHKEAILKHISDKRKNDKEFSKLLYSRVKRSKEKKLLLLSIETQALNLNKQGGNPPQ